MRTEKLIRRGSAGAILLSGAFAIAPFILPSVAHAAKVKVLHSFGSGYDGFTPNSGVVRGTDGTLYGTVPYGGGQSGCGGTGCGMIYKITPRGEEVILHAFTSSEGNGPLAEPALDSSGNLYGSACCGGQGGYGALFKLAPDGTYTELHDFTGGSDGGTPMGVVVDSEGNIFGTTMGGGESADGVLYEITAQGQFRVLHSFTGGADDGFLPTGRPLVDDNGNIYGTTQGGGQGSCGTIFKVTPKGKEEVLHSFVAHKEGCYPYAGVVRDSAGNLYTTTYGGPQFNMGTSLVELSPSGRLTVLHYFGSPTGYGVYGPPTLIQDENGDIQIYGLTAYGGFFGYGTAYKYSGNGQYQIIYNFRGGQGPSIPRGMMAVGHSGNLYGVTASGGANCQDSGGCGTVFKLRIQ